MYRKTQSLKKYLVIQTASIGDVILSTSIGEKLRINDKECQIDYLVKKGNEGVFYGNMEINEVYIWDKSKEKYKNLLRLIFQIQFNKYDAVFNLQRFFSSGLITAFSQAKKKYGFKKNPLSFTFSKSFPHEYKEKWHEIHRNHQLIEHLTDSTPALPKLYPTQKDYAKMSIHKTHPYITITPASLWFTKQFPFEKWKVMIKEIAPQIHVYYLGGPADQELCDRLLKESDHQNSINFAGKLTFVESAALMRDALMNFVNDSAAQHIASSVNAHSTSIYCSTVAKFGFGPLSDDSLIIETNEKLACRPCGLHGHPSCPEGHFKCGTQIDTQSLLNRIQDAS